MKIMLFIHLQNIQLNQSNLQYLIHLAQIDKPWVYCNRMSLHLMRLLKVLNKLFEEFLLILN